MTSTGRARLRYVALGDSYTIGTSVDPADGWPIQLVAAVTRLAGAHDTLELVANLAVNGRTTEDLIRDQLPGLDRWNAEFVTVLIGVNDVVQGVPRGDYEANLRTLFASLLGSLPPGRIVTVGIPDYTVTERGADYGDPERQSREIEAFNAIMAAEAAQRAIPFVNVFDLSRRARADRSLVAADGLHPSGLQYRLWVDRIAPVVAALLAAESPGPQ